MRTLKADLQNSFGKRFLDFQEGLDGEYWLYVDSTVFTNDILTVITQFGFAYHVGFVCSEVVGYLKPHLRIKLKKYQ